MYVDEALLKFGTSGKEINNNVTTLKEIRVLLAKNPDEIKGSCAIIMISWKSAKP